MLDALTVLSAPAAVTLPLASFHTVVDSIGGVTFWARLIDFLDDIAGGEHCVAWMLDNEHMIQVGAASWNGAGQAQRRLLQYADPKFWRRDPALAMARRHPVQGAPILIRMNPRQVPDTLIRETLYGEDHIGERIVLCARRHGHTVGLSVVRAEDRGPFSAEQLNVLMAMSNTLLSVVAKHHQIVSTRQAYNPVSAEQIPDIESVLMQSPSSLSHREAQVCARLVCGHSLALIASALNVGAETVETYRKRAYRRLGVSSKHDLLLKYVGYR